MIRMRPGSDFWLLAAWICCTIRLSRSIPTLENRCDFCRTMDANGQIAKRLVGFPRVAIALAARQSVNGRHCHFCDPQRSGSRNP